METPIDWEKIARLLEAGSPDLGELAPHELDAFREAQQLWEGAGLLGQRRPSHLPDIAQAKARMQARMAPRRRSMWPALATGVAASLLLALAGYWGYRALQGPEAFEQAWQAEAQPQNAALPDGSRMELREGACQAFFGKQYEARLLKLQGTAFFQVAHGHPKPFVVQGPQGEMQALGTAFVAIAHPDSSVVSVSEGAVRFRPSAGQEASWQAVARAGEEIAFSEGHLRKRLPQGRSIDLLPDQAQFEATLEDLAQFAADWKGVALVWGENVPRQQRLSVTSPVGCHSPEELMEKGLLPLPELQAVIEGGQLRVSKR
jgi:hypothetical protein